MSALKNKTGNASGAKIISEAQRKKKAEESNKNLLLWGIIGVFVLINAVIIYQNNIKVQFELVETSSGHFVGSFQGELSGHQAKASNDISSQLKSNRSKITSLDLQLGLNAINAEHILLISSGLSKLDHVRELKISLSHNEIGDDGLYVIG